MISTRLFFIFILHKTFTKSMKYQSNTETLFSIFKFLISHVKYNLQ